MSSYKELHKLEMKYASGGRVSGHHALNAVKQAMAHLKVGNLAAAKATLEKSPHAMRHPLVQRAMPLLNQAMGQAPPMMAEGGEVETVNEPGVRTSSPGSPGISGAIKDAVNAARDYFIDRPRRELSEERREHIDRVVNAEEPGYADGGKVAAVKDMMKFMVEKLGLDPADAQRLSVQYHARVNAPSGTARQMANDIVSRPPLQQMPKSPAELAAALRAGFVAPSDLNHLLYSDPALTPLINRYQSGIDNQNLTPAQKQALIAKLESMGAQSPPQLPQTAETPQGIDALLSQSPQ